MGERTKNKYKDDENKLLIAKILDKYEFAITKNKITYTDFLNISEISIAQNALKEEKIKNYVLYSGKEEADRKLLIFYPEKFSIDMIEKNYEKILSVIRIELPNNISYEHREFLSGLMKLGIKREKIGDIIVTDNGADIIVLSEIASILVEDLKQLTRFRKANISIEKINNIVQKENEFEEIKIIVSSFRLDNFVSELARTSRSQTEEIINQGRVFINSINELKLHRRVVQNDIITIRGKGKFIFSDIERETKSGKLLVNIKKYK